MTASPASQSGEESCLDVTAEEWVRAARDLRDSGFTFFDWLSAVDQTDDPEAPGFDLVLHVYDVSRRGAVRGQLMHTRIAEGAAIQSLTSIFKGAAWHEREVHEMFGIDVAGFDDGSGHGLRPLLLPNGFEGNPLRKSFVLAARALKPWPGAKEPGESDDGRRAAPGRRRMQPPGVPPADWGQR
jgi:NADH-quinone oxidoreductase subunit C